MGQRAIFCTFNSSNSQQPSSDEAGDRKGQTHTRTRAHKHLHLSLPFAFLEWMDRVYQYKEGVTRKEWDDARSK